MPDKRSVISGLESDFGEWEAITKFNILKDMERRKQLKFNREEESKAMREELRKQEQEFKARQTKFRTEMLQFAR